MAAVASSRSYFPWAVAALGIVFGVGFLATMIVVLSSPGAASRIVADRPVSPSRPIVREAASPVGPELKGGILLFGNK